MSYKVNRDRAIAEATRKAIEEANRTGKRATISVSYMDRATDWLGGTKPQVTISADPKGEHLSGHEKKEDTFYGVDHKDLFSGKKTWSEY